MEGSKNRKARLNDQSLEVEGHNPHVILLFAYLFLV